MAGGAYGHALSARGVDADPVADRHAVVSSDHELDLAAQPASRGDQHDFALAARVVRPKPGDGADQYLLPGWNDLRQFHHRIDDGVSTGGRSFSADQSGNR